MFKQKGGIDSNICTRDRIKSCNKQRKDGIIIPDDRHGNGTFTTEI